MVRCELRDVRLLSTVNHHNETAEHPLFRPQALRALCGESGVHALLDVSWGVMTVITDQLQTVPHEPRLPSTYPTVPYVQQSYLIRILRGLYFWDNAISHQSVAQHAWEDHELSRLWYLFANPRGA